MFPFKLRILFPVHLMPKLLLLKFLSILQSCQNYEEYKNNAYTWRRDRRLYYTICLDLKLRFLSNIPKIRQCATIKEENHGSQYV